MESKTTKKYLLSGTVQGVGMRFFIRQTARRLELKGYVKNLSDGRVECIVQGLLKTINNFEDSLKKESPGRINDIENKIIENDKQYKKFRVKFR
ncbi:MAG: acylphosphatase [Candidatus Izimaplasma sp.]|nr:acylphosphatase [Candidatus Izimaplasma bacterium]